jgi:hypothetical protein
MAVCWRCPDCTAETCHTEYIDPRDPVSCEACGREFDRGNVLCTVCHSPNALMRRDSIHYWCLECGHTQALWAVSA